MSVPTLTIFANFRIDQEERFMRMQDSFLSFKDICAQHWVINVRGSYKEKVHSFLATYLENRLEISFLESKAGWFRDTREIMSGCTSEFVLFWIEDHINMVPVEVYQTVLKELSQAQCDILSYSFYHPETLKPYHYVSGDPFSTLTAYTLTKSAVCEIERQLGGVFHIVSALSILKTSVFKKIINSTHPLLKKWPKYLPFDFEKTSDAKQFLPLITAVPRLELFASIDAGPTEAYSLIGRGLYPNRMDRASLHEIEFKPKKYKIKSFIPPQIWEKARQIYKVFLRLKYTLNI